MSNPIAGVKPFGIDLSYVIVKFIRDTIVAFASLEVVTTDPTPDLETLGAALLPALGLVVFRAVRDLVFPAVEETTEE